MKKRFTEEQIIKILNRNRSGEKAKDLARGHRREPSDHLSVEEIIRRDDGERSETASRARA